MAPPSNHWDAQVGRGDTPQALTHISLYSNLDASIPMGFSSASPSLSLKDYLHSWSDGTTTEFEDTMEGIVEADDVQEARWSNVVHYKTRSVNLWEANHSEIERLYIKENQPLWKVRTIMAARGFDAPDHAYKKRLKKWKLSKNKSVKNYAQSSNRKSTLQSSASESSQRRMSTSTSTLHEEISIHSNSSYGAEIFFQRPHFSLDAPRFLPHIDSNEPLDAILFHVKKLYIGSLEQKKWRVSDPFVVKEDNHGDLHIRIQMALQCLDSDQYYVGGSNLRYAFIILERVVVSCGLFSLTSIWESYLRMIRKGRRDIARTFLGHAFDLCIAKAGHTLHHPFVQVVKRLLRLGETDHDMLEHVITRAYRSCIDHVEQELSSYHLTTLILRSGFLVFKV